MRMMVVEVLTGSVADKNKRMFDAACLRTNYMIEHSAPLLGELYDSSAKLFQSRYLRIDPAYAVLDVNKIWAEGTQKDFVLKAEITPHLSLIDIMSLGVELEYVLRALVDLRRSFLQIITVDVARKGTIKL